MQVHDEELLRFIARHLSRALLRTEVRVSNPAYRHVVGVIVRAVHDQDIRRLVDGVPLFLRYEKAFAWRPGSVERLVILEEVGDAGLLVSSYWRRQETVRHEPIDVEYVTRLGRLAYRCIGTEPYRELADKYSPLVDAMTVLASYYAPLVHRDQSILALYQAWEERHETRTARILRRLGIPVVPGSTART